MAFPRVALRFTLGCHRPRRWRGERIGNYELRSAVMGDIGNVCLFSDIRVRVVRVLPFAHLVRICRWIVFPRVALRFTLGCHRPRRWRGDRIGNYELGITNYELWVWGVSRMCAFSPIFGFGWSECFRPLSGVLPYGRDATIVRRFSPLCFIFQAYLPKAWNDRPCFSDRLMCYDRPVFVCLWL